PKATLDVNGDILVSNSGLPMGLFTELAGSNTPVFNLSVNTRPASEIDIPSIGGVFRIDSRSNNQAPLFQWLKKKRNESQPGLADILMSLGENGHLGIGTLKPQNKLDIEGGLAVGSTYSGANSAPLNGAIIEGSVGLGTNIPQNKLDIEGGVAVGSTYSGTNIAPTNGAIIEGSVGIGTPTPTRAKVHIEGSTGFAYGQYGFLDGNGNTGPFSGTNPYSLYAANFIMAGQVHAFSDARIKNIIGPSDRQSDLNTLMDIQITDYQYIDTIQKGPKLQKKVIAQQVAEVFPEAVSSTVTDVVPDIYQRATVADGWIQLATDLQVGERVKIITETGSQIHEVNAAESNRFQVADFLATTSPSDQPYQVPKAVFVYGREVTDFHVVDYEAISMLNVSATQELSRKVEVLEEENTQLKAEIKKMEALAQRLTQIEALLPSTTRTNR
ncbi:MAG: tail fiber domain-containing protein, partial [Bacteroidota bacterium]